MASAPIFEVTRRDVVAVEHPMVVKNLDNALKTFGVGGDTTGRPFRRVSNGHVLRPPPTKRSRLFS
jgi:general transcription factor 3C polypeptide 5 (transcription factor C subunit 1)